MKQLLSEYGRVILALIMFLIVLLLVPHVAKPLNKSTEGLIDEVKDDYEEDDFFYFYVDNRRYTAHRDANGNAPTWEEWMRSDDNVDGFTIAEIQECGKWYLVKESDLVTGH